MAVSTILSPSIVSNRGGGMDGRRWEGGGGRWVGGGRGVGGGRCVAPNRTAPTDTSSKETAGNANRTEPNRNTHGYCSSNRYKKEP